MLVSAQLSCFAQIMSGPQIEAVLKTKKLLRLDSSLPDKAEGFRLAEGLNFPEINNALVNMLDDETKGGRISNDVLVLDPWLEAMHLLARRFPEAGVKEKRLLQYDSSDKERFKNWWSENREKISYLQETVNETKRLLKLDASLRDKAEGFRLAEYVDTLEVNDALVAVLDDESSGGRISNDVGIGDPWTVAMHLLARRFPEAGVIDNRFHAYDSDDKTLFKKWWSENKNRLPDVRKATLAETQKFLRPSSSLPDKAEGLRLAERINAPEVNEALVAMLDDESGGGRIPNREIKALRMLARRFSEAGDHSHLALLDDESSKGDKYETLEAPWRVAMHILVRRFFSRIDFPGPHLTARAYLEYDSNDKALFKKWWAEHKNRIEYSNGGHSVLPKTQ